MPAASARGAHDERPVQLSLEAGLADPPPLPALTDWEAMLADYAASDISVDRHPLALLRERLAGDGAVCSADLSRIGHGTAIEVAGLVIARQRPGTAKGVAFLLLEDEHGTVNLIVPPPLYERRRALVRGEPLLIAAGRLERHADGGGAVNVLVSDLRALCPDGADAAEVSSLQEARERREAPAGSDRRDDGAAEDFRAVAPAVTSFARGRRR